MASFTTEIYSVVSTRAQPSLPISVSNIATMANHVLHSSGMSHILRLMKVLPVSHLGSYSKKSICSDPILCGGRELNPRTPARLDPESSAFDHLATPAQEDACSLHLYYIMVFVSVNVLLMVLLMTFISGLFRKTDLTLE